MKNNKILSLVGLATKAGKTVSGEFSTEKSVKTGKGFHIITPPSSSEKRFIMARLIRISTIRTRDRAEATL